MYSINRTEEMNVYAIVPQVKQIHARLTTSVPVFALFIELDYGSPLQVGLKN